MPEGRIRVPVELSQAAPYISTQAQNFSSELAALRSQVVALAGTWKEGPARLAYQGMQANWDGAAENLFGANGVLEIIAHALRRSDQNFTDTEVANTAQWRTG